MNNGGNTLCNSEIEYLGQESGGREGEVKAEQDRFPQWMLAREDKVRAGARLVESQIEKPFPSRLPQTAPGLQHPPKLPMAPPPHIGVLLSIYRISFSSPPLRSHYLAHLVSSKWRIHSSKNLNFITRTQKLRGGGVCFKAA